VLQWGRLSDHIGRKPVILIGLLGTTISMLAFGLSRSFGALILSRCLTGLLNGNIGVMKSLMGELTDSTNRAEGYAWLPVVWGFGVTIGPLIGGSLSHPHERFSKVFSGSFWKEYPYFLPCLVTSSYVVFAFLVTLVILKEPLATKKNSQPSSLESCNDSDSTTALVHENDPLPLHKVLTYPVILSIFNFGTVAFLDIAAMALLPLFLAMPLDIGGLNFDPSFIGYVMGSLGLVDAIFQIFFFSSIVRRWGERNVFIAAMSAFVPIFLIFPLINWAARGWGSLSLGVWVLIGILIVLVVIMDLGFGAIFIFLTAAAPNQRSLGTTNGLSQTTVSIARAIGPALSTSLFSFSVENRILGGYGVYVAFAALSVCAVYFATYLPTKPWDQHESDPDI